MRLSAILLVLAACSGTIETPDPADDDATANGEIDANDSIEQAPMVTLQFDESSDELVNPERGFYAGYSLVGGSSAAYVRDGGKSLAITMVRLDDYRDRALDDALLTALSAGFEKVRAAGIKSVLRFAYNASETEDASKARILQHLEQLTPLLQANADVIAVMQAGFIGAWGEWHSSTNGLGNDADRTEILNAILAALPEERSVQVRTPMFKEAAFPGGPTSASEAYDGSPASRVGHHNDCFLASDSDYGTYDPPVAEWKAYVAGDGLYLPTGGETCAVYAPRTDCDSALAEMETLHWSYLNSQYNLNVLNGWVAQGCDAEVKKRLGYRFALARVAHTEAVAPGGELDVEIDIVNRGFAAPYNRRPVQIVLTDGTTRRAVHLADLDARRWAPGETTTLTTKLRIPADLAAGSYTLALRLPDEATSLADDPRYSIRLANDNVWEESTGDNVLTRELLIDPSAPGARDPEAMTFAEIR